MSHKIKPNQTKSVITNWFHNKGKEMLICFVCTCVFACCKMFFCLGGARGVMVIVVGNGHGNTSSNPGRD